MQIKNRWTQEVILEIETLLEADLRGAVLSGADLRRADLSRAVLSGITICDALIDGAIIGNGLKGHESATTIAMLTPEEWNNINNNRKEK